MAKCSRWLLALILLAGCLQLARADQDVSQMTARPSPDWLRTGTIYEIFPRDFSAAGNLPSITARLDELHSLGVSILWVMPIHPIGEKNRKGTLGSPYSIQNYYAIDPSYGTLDDLKQLVAGAHQRGMKVLMDFVANHTAWDSVMLTNKNFYKQNNAGQPIPPMPDWADVLALNYANPALRDYMVNVTKYWVKEADVDGFRCDAAHMVPTDFWEQVRTELTKIKPDIMLLAEASKPEFLTKAFDIDYDWPLLHTMNDVLMSGASANKIQRCWENSRTQFPKSSLHLRLTDNMDETRAISRYGFNGALAASALMFTLDGVPLIYNGMEVGDATESGDPALFEKMNVCWNPHQSDRPQFRSIYHDLIQLRKTYAALRNDRVEWLNNSDDSRLVTFLRGDGKDELLVVINLSNRPLTGTVDLKKTEGFTTLKFSGGQSSDGGPLPAFQLNGFEWRIYHRAISARVVEQ